MSVEFAMFLGSSLIGYSFLAERDFEMFRHFVLPYQKPQPRPQVFSVALHT